MQAARQQAFQRRITGGALKQQMLDFLREALPAGWISQPLEPAGRPAAADILIISPRGRCHFLFVRAPADRWWDGGPHSVPAERFPPEAVCLARRLRSAGHRARAVWGAQDLARALRAWGCVPERAVRFALPPAALRRPPLPVKQMRPTLHLKGWGRRGDA
jgi:hypothetical protein